MINTYNLLKYSAGGYFFAKHDPKPILTKDRVAKIINKAQKVYECGLT
jgi:hypothetical protein